VIVRIATEGQYRLPDGDAEKLNDSTTRAVVRVERDDEDGFHSTFEQMLELVRREGQPLGDDELEDSDVILPPPDLSFVEAAAEFTG
jgi:hypothetical protein